MAHGRHFKAIIKNNIEVSGGFFLLTFSPQIEHPVSAEPGQFFMVSASDRGNDPLLKRPFSLFRNTEDGTQILYRVSGKGTAMLSRMKNGMALNALGPLGNSYPLPSKKHTPVIVAGGIGIASVFPLIEKLSGQAHVFYGVRTKEELLFLDELKTYSKGLYVSTDDGSCGIKGTVIDALEKEMSSFKEGSVTPYACGPKGMLKTVSEFATYRGLQGYVSLEENMACGFGVCLGCAVKTVNGYKRVCKEGPVFKMEDIVWQTSK